MFAEMLPDGSTLTVAEAMAPFFGPALARCSGLNTVVMYPILERDGSTMDAIPMP